MKPLSPQGQLDRAGKKKKEKRLATMMHSRRRHVELPKPKQTVTSKFSCHVVLLSYRVCALSSVSFPVVIHLFFGGGEIMK